MTLLVSVLTSSGVVMTSDSRQTYRNAANVLRVGSDSGNKMFRLSARSGVSIAGRAFINEDGKPLREVGYFIGEFSKVNDCLTLSVKEISERINKFLGDIFIAREIKALKELIEAEAMRLQWKNLEFGPAKGTIQPFTYIDASGQHQAWNRWIDTIELFVAGVDQDGVGRVASVKVGHGIVNECATTNPTAMWLGQTDVLWRIVKGYAPEIDDLQFVKDAVAKDLKGATAQANTLEYIINWGTITIQDAVDFCVLMTKTTESIQRFSDGTVGKPGGIPGVGGPIDVAIITHENGFEWLQKKQLTAGQDSVDR